MNMRSVAIIGVVLALLIGLYIMVSAHMNVSPLTGTPPAEIKYSELMQKISAGQVKSLEIHNDDATGTFADGKTPFKVTLPPFEHTALDNALDAKGVSVKYQSNRTSLLMSVISTLLPVILIIGIWIFFMRQMQGGGRGAMGFGKSKARLLTEHKNRVTFGDVAGVDEAKEELQEVVDFLKDPSKFQKLGGKIPKGALLVGPPGTGKTLLARAVAGEAGVPFFSISGSDFVEMFVGVGASRVRDMFDQAKKNAPCIIFIDEIDAVGRHRGAGHGGGNDEREQTLNQLLVEMDGFEANEGIIMIAATNRPDVLDSALLRPGRFDRQVTVPNPDLIGREAILRVHMKNVPLAVDVNVKVIARGTPGFSGADLANLVNEAALMAARKDRKLVTMRDFEDAKDKVLMGAERKSMAMSEEEKKLTAYHEGGHAIIALKVPEADPVHKATIIPRGRALGVTWTMPERDVLNRNQKQMKADLAMSFGGRIAEQLIYGEDELNTGAASDLQHATSVARAMVMDYGMSKKLGWLKYREDEPSYAGSRSHISEETSQLIDAEVRALVEEAEAVARKVLTDNLDQLHRLGEALLVYETLSGEETKKVIVGEDIGRPDPGSTASIVPASGSSIPKTRRPSGPFGNPAPAGA